MNQHESSSETHALSNISALEFEALGAHILFIFFILGCAKRAAQGWEWMEVKVNRVNNKAEETLETKSSGLFNSPGLLLVLGCFLKTLISSGIHFSASFLLYCYLPPDQGPSLLLFPSFINSFFLICFCSMVVL